MPKPVKVGEEYDVEINEVGSRGDGIARIKNFVVFINGVKQGEKARIRITEVRNRFAVAEKAGDASEAASDSSEGEMKDTTEETVAEAEAEAETASEGSNEEGESEGESENEEEMK
jgi:predicted RNA-binding protein with TRAM domain